MGMMADPKRWLVLVGGGGCGRWQAGALTSLWEAGLLDKLSGIVGTSVGGLDACVLAVGMAQGKGAQVLKDAWDQIQRDEDVYTPSFNHFSFWNPFDVLRLAKNAVFNPGLCSSAPLKKIVARTMGEWTTDEIKKASGLTLAVRAFNYKLGVEETLQGRLQDMALATSAIEAVFPSHMGYGDGGVMDNSPMDVALAHKARQILVVYCSAERPSNTPRPPTRLPLAEPAQKGTAIHNALDLLGHLTLANEDLVSQAADQAEKKGVRIVHCFPASDTGSALDFSERGLWQRGVQEAKLAIAQARKLKWA
jgi:predicted acylesterase/phospholipase RssA